MIRPLQDGVRLIPFSIFEEQSLVPVDGILYLTEKEAKQWLLWEPHCIFVPFIYQGMPIKLIDKPKQLLITFL